MGHRLVEIAQGWYNYLKGSPKTRQLMYSRLEVCDDCDKKREFNSVGKLVFSGMKENTYHCGECGCPLGSKAANPDSTCPLNKWSTINPQTYYR